MGLAVKNNNPGNLKDPGTGQFRQFSSPQEGYAALLNDLQGKQNGTSSTGLGPSSTLVDFASKYAPANDKNNVGKYTADLANQLGVAPNAQLKDLDLAKWAAAVAKNEDRDSIFGNQRIVQTPQEQEVAQKNTGVPEQPFSTPLSHFASGDSDAVLRGSTGALKGALKVIRDTSGVDTNPVVKGMVANAPEFAKALEANKQFIETDTGRDGDFEQNKGFNMSQLGAALVGPGTQAKAGIDAYKAATLPGKTLSAVSPRLTPKVAAETQKTAPQGVRGLISTVPTKRTKEVAELTQKVYNPSKTFSENASNVNNLIGQKATQLEDYLTQKNIPYIFKELQSDFKKVDIPHFIKTSDAVTKKRAQSIINKFMEIAKKNEGNLHSLLKTRKEFDDWVLSEYPRVFDESGNAINKLVSNIREASKKFIETRAPESGIRQSLKEQHLLYDALDTFNEKAVLGELNKAGEIGSTYLSRFGANHPGVMGTIDFAKKAAITGGVGLLGLDAFNRLRGN